MIKRFELSVDLFWKYIKRYLEKVVSVEPEISGPNHVIRTACKVNLITEKDAEIFLELIKCRNQTSHIYQEEIADRLSVSIPGFCKLIRKYVEKLAP